jgi:hypothetical protein
VRPTGAAGNEDVDILRAANHRNHLIVVVCVHEPGPQV